MKKLQCLILNFPEWKSNRQKLSRLLSLACAHNDVRHDGPKKILCDVYNDIYYILLKMCGIFHTLLLFNYCYCVTCRRSFLRVVGQIQTEGFLAAPCLQRGRQLRGPRGQGRQ